MRFLMSAILLSNPKIVITLTDDEHVQVELHEETVVGDDTYTGVHEFKTEPGFMPNTVQIPSTSWMFFSQLVYPNISTPDEHKAIAAICSARALIEAL